MLIQIPHCNSFGVADRGRLDPPATVGIIYCVDCRPRGDGNKPPYPPSVGNDFVDGETLSFEFDTLEDAVAYRDLLAIQCGGSK